MKKEEKKVNVRNDKEMVDLGIRKPLAESRDKSVWSRSRNERKTLNYVKYSQNKGDWKFHSKPQPYSYYRDKLVIYVKTSKTFPKTTYSIECSTNDIPRILSHYQVVKNKEMRSVVTKYSFGGKTYAATELPRI